MNFLFWLPFHLASGKQAVLQNLQPGFHLEKDFFSKKTAHAYILLQISWCIVGIPEDVSPASYCILKPHQSCGGDGSSSSGSTRFRRSSWTRDMELRFPDWQPTVSAARPGDSSAGRKTACSISPKHFCTVTGLVICLNTQQLRCSTQLQKISRKASYYI